MEKYVYILVAVIWVVSSLFKKKKPATSTLPPFNPDATVEKEERTIETILKEMLTGQKEFEPVNNPKKLPQESKRKKIKPIENIKKTPIARDIAPLATMPSGQDTNEGVLTEEVITNIDFKKAIIYSEIINRPKYLDC